MNRQMNPHDCRLRNHLTRSAAMAAALAALSYGTDFLVRWSGREGSRTIWNDVLIGVLGGVALFYYLMASQRRDSYECAKERLQMIAQVNWRVRQTLMRMASSALSEDRHARLQGIDEATERIDTILSELSNRSPVEHRSLPS